MNNKFLSDYKTASYTFLWIIFVSLVYQVFFSALHAGNVINAEEFWTMLVLTAGSYVLYFGVFLLVCKQCRISGPVLYKELNISKKVSVKDLYSVALLAGLCLSGFMLVTKAFDDLMGVLGYVTESNISLDSFEMYIAMVVVIAVLPAIVEELLFRGIILKGLLRFGKAPAILSSALLFSLFHLSPAQTFYQFVLGIILAIIVIRTGKLVYAMVFHFVNNFAALTIQYIAGDIGLLFSWGAVSIAMTVGLALFSILFIWQILKRYKHEEQSTAQKEKARQRFFTFDNIGFFVCLLVSGMVWLSRFVGA